MIRSPGGYRPSAHSQTFNALMALVCRSKQALALIKVTLVGHVGKQGWQKGFKLVLG